MDKTLNIAHCVESYYPYQGGMPEVVKQLSERMVRAGHHITVFTSSHHERKESVINGVSIRSFAIEGNAVNGIKGNTAEYLDALKAGKFDVVVFFAAQQWSFDSVADHLHEIPGKKIFVPTGFSHFHNAAYRKYFESMKKWLKDFDMNVFLSDNYQDINLARENGVKNITLIPNGAAEEEFEPINTFHIREKIGVREDELMILHVGSYTGIKGHREALKIFIGSAARNATLVLVGNKIKYLEGAFNKHYSYIWLRLLARIRRKKIVFTELSREDTVAAFKSADLFLFPSNVECSPIVLFESMAAETPFLASDAGNTSEIIEWSNAGWLLPGSKERNGWARVDIPGSIRKLDQVIANREEMQKKGAAGRDAWKKKFTWQKIAEQYIQLYKSLVS